ncbi:MAG: hypothetical protein ACQEQV_10715 [Fibrobacterota bacterium]
MKRLIFLICALAGTGTAKEYIPAQQYSVTRQERKATADRTITDPETYNSYRHFGLRTGLLDSRTLPISTGISMRRIAAEGDSTAQKGLQFYLPFVTIGTPQRHFFSFHYGLNPLSRSGSTEADSLTGPEHSFGMHFITQNPDKTFRFGFGFDGAVGHPTSERTNTNGDAYSRDYYSLENAGIIMGTRISDLITLSFAGEVSARFDSLDNHSSVDQDDRFFEIELPRVSTTMEISRDGLPYTSAFGWSYGRKNFVYSTRSSELNTMKSNWIEGATYDADPIITDSVYWHWQNRWDAHLSANALLHPAVDMGYMHSRYSRMLPGDDNHPFSYDGAADGKTWENRSFQFGLGTSLVLHNAVDLFMEYGRSSMSLDLTGSELPLSNDSISDTQWYNRFNTGATWMIHESANLGATQLFFDLSLLLLQENCLTRTYYASDVRESLTPARTASQLYRYTPWDNFEKDVKSRNIALGMRALFNDSRLETNINVGFLKQTFSGDEKTTETGTQFNVDLIYNVPNIAASAQ